MAKKKLNKKKASGIGAGIAAVVAAVTLSLFGISGDTVIECDYTIEEKANLVEMMVNPPEELGADIAELYCNGEAVTKSLLPKGKLSSIPFVFTNLENLEIRFYKLNEVIGIGNFSDGKLYVAVKDDILPKDYPTVDNGEVQNEK